jgi:mersacidin/lichenicidin family type 2 lantibiotic
MGTTQLVRSWKDEDFRLALSAEDRPAHPAGDPEAEVYVNGSGAPHDLNTCETIASCALMCSWL